MIFQRLINLRSYLGKKRLVGILPIAILIIAISLTVFISQKQQNIRQRASFEDTPSPVIAEAINFSTLNFFKLFGQNKPTETVRNTISGKKIFHSSGVLVDKSNTPNKIYVVDSGNNRILGFNGIGFCSQSVSQTCTVDNDCGTGNNCRVDGTKDPDLVFGQPDFTSGACNRDDNLGIYKDPSADTLCLLGKPYVANVAESWARTNFAVDMQGNLYVPDRWNNRILKYNQPFSLDKTGGKGDTIADFVLGQESFTTNKKNGVVNYSQTESQPSEKSLWIDYSGNHTSYGGVSIDSDSNVWIADTINYRVLRFFPNSNSADLVIGQSNFTQRNISSDCFSGRQLSQIQLNTLCSPILAKVDPETGKLYVLDEYDSAFKARILVFDPPFTNGMVAARQFIPNLGPGSFFNNEPYFFQASGFEFNPYRQGEYADGKLWINELQTNRTILVDENGVIIKVIGAPDATTKGGDSVYNTCGLNIYDGFNLSSPGGSIGFDSASNIYLADEHSNRITRYALPYELQAIDGKMCPPPPNGGLFPGIGKNTITNQGLGEAVGTSVFQNQLIVLDEGRQFKVWNDYLAKPLGAGPDYVIKRNDNPGRILFGEAIDDQNRLWVINSFGELVIYQLPFISSDTAPIAQVNTLYWQDDQTPIQFGTPVLFETGITFDQKNKAIYIADRDNHRVLRIKNYNDFQAKLFVDLVIGQPNKASVNCNFNQEMTPWLAEGAPAADSLCYPMGVRFDKLGNLYVVESGYECHGNNRITVFLEEDIRNTNALFPLSKAKKVFNANSLTQQVSSSGCSPNVTDKPGTPVSIAFNSANQMIIGNDGYYGNTLERSIRQLWFYADPLDKQTPDGYIPFPMGAPGEIVIDSFNNIVIQDHTWSRVQIINPGQDPSLLVSLTSSPLTYVPLSPIPSAPLSPTPTPINTPTPVLPTPTIVPTPTSIPDGKTSAHFKIALFGIVDSPSRPNRKLNIEIFDPENNNEKIADLTADISHDPSVKQFKKNHVLDALPKSGIYNIKVKSDGYLRRLILSVRINKGVQNDVPLATLIPGDINGDNKIDLLDYNLFITCYGTKANQPTCDKTVLKLADFDDNIVIDGIDYNTFIKGLSVKEGD